MEELNVFVAAHSVSVKKKNAPERFRGQLLKP